MKNKFYLNAKNNTREENRFWLGFWISLIVLKMIDDVNRSTRKEAKRRKTANPE